MSYSLHLSKIQTNQLWFLLYGFITPISTLPIEYTVLYGPVKPPVNGQKGSGQRRQYSLGQVCTGGLFGKPLPDQIDRQQSPQHKARRCHGQVPANTTHQANRNGQHRCVIFQDKASVGFDPLPEQVGVAFVEQSVVAVFAFVGQRGVPGRFAHGVNDHGFGARTELRTLVTCLIWDIYYI